MNVDIASRLRPRSLGELLDQAIRLYRRNFLKLTAVVALIQVPVTLLSLLFSLVIYSSSAMQLQEPGAVYPDDPMEIFDANYFVGVGGGCGVGILSFFLVYGVLPAAMARSVADSYLGVSSGFFDAYRKIGSSWLRVLGALLIAFLVGIVLFIWLLIPCIGWMTGLGMWVFYLWAVVPLVTPIIVLEKQGVADALLRAWELTRRRFWWVMGFVFVLYLFNQLITSGPAFLLGLGIGALREVLTDSLGVTGLATLQTILQSLVTMAISLVSLPLQQVCMLLMYFDLRVRTEGFDLALQAEEATSDEMGVDIEAVLAEAPAPARSGLITWTEIGQFSAVSLAGLVLAVALYAVLAGIGLVIMGAGGMGGF